MPVIYDGLKLDVGYKADLIVEDLLILELKSVQQLAPVHKAQLLTYLKLAHKEIGLLLNFNTAHLRDGIVRIINSLPPSRPSFLSCKISSVKKKTPLPVYSGINFQRKSVTVLLRLSKNLVCDILSFVVKLESLPQAAYSALYYKKLCFKLRDVVRGLLFHMERNGVTAKTVTP